MTDDQARILAKVTDVIDHPHSDLESALRFFVSLRAMTEAPDLTAQWRHSLAVPAHFGKRRCRFRGRDIPLISNISGTFVAPAGRCHRIRRDLERSAFRPRLFATIFRGDGVGLSVPTPPLPSLCGSESSDASGAIPCGLGGASRYPRSG